MFIVVGDLKFCWTYLLLMFALAAEFVCEAAGI